MPDMPETTDHNVGKAYGGGEKADINVVNQWMRSTPWYAQKLQQWGFQPGQPVQLNDSQKKELVHVAQAQGVKVDEGDVEIDDSGNFRSQGHKLRNTLIVAGIAAASIATMGAAGVFAGAAGAGAGAAGGAGAGAASLGGVGGTLGMSAALPGAVSAIPGLAGAAGAAGSLGGIAGVAGKVGALGKLGGLIQDGSKLGSTLGALGQGIGAATSAAGNNDMLAADQDVRVNNSNVTGNAAFEQELMNRSKTENNQRMGSLQDVYRASMAQHPSVSPYNTQGAQKQSPEYLKALADLAAQGSNKLATGGQYDTNKMAPLAPYKPINPAKPGGSTLQKVGNWLGPGMSVAGKISSFF